MKWKCGCSYDGSEYAGWQTQNGQISVQQVLEEALESIFKRPVKIAGSGRTDAGVHALEQVFHFDANWEHGSDRLLKALYPKLPKSIRVHAANLVGDDFHSRFSAVSKRYHYRLFLGQADPFHWPYCWSVPARIDLNVLQDGMGRLVGKHDFAAFAANRGMEYETTVRELRVARLSQHSGFTCLTFEADGFMYKMARSLVNLALGRMTMEDLEELLSTAQRTPMVQVAPARGLFLEKVFY